MTVGEVVGLLDWVEEVKGSRKTMEAQVESWSIYGAESRKLSLHSCQGDGRVEKNWLEVDYA